MCGQHSVLGLRYQRNIGVQGVAYREKSHIFTRKFKAFNDLFFKLSVVWETNKGHLNLIGEVQTRPWAVVKDRIYVY